LIGVVVGGFISGGVSLLLERRKERGAARVAARVVREDLLQLALWIEDSVTQGRWLGDSFQGTGKKAWIDERGRLAHVLNYEQYASVLMAEQVFDRVNSWIVRRGDRLELDEKDRDQFGLWLEDLRRGLTTLLEIAK
jgi:hypothetical protein